MSNFYEDLVRIRKSKRLSKQDVFFKCRLPMETIESIEDGSILSGSLSNKTYMRSYFRTYAKALGISSEDITTALDEHDIGLYAQGLLLKYLPEEAQTGSETKDEETSDDKKSTKRKSAGKDADSNDPKAGIREESTDTADDTLPRPYKSKIITPKTQEKSIKDIEWEDENIKKVRSTSTIDSVSSAKERSPAQPDSVSTPQSDTPAPPDIGGIDWASKVKQAVYRPQKNRLLWVILATLLALALALLSIIWFWRSGDPEPAEPATVESHSPAEAVPPVAGDGDIQTAPQPQTGTPEATDPVPPDVTAADEPEAVEEAPPPPPTREEILAQLAAAATTGDTLFIHAYALHGNLEPIRVVSDIFAGEDIQTFPARPYWVAQHHAMRLDFLDEIILRGSLARMVLLFNGHVIDDFSDFYSDGSEVLITRDLLMQHDMFEIADDDPFTELDPPRTIVDRPRFSP